MKILILSNCSGGLYTFRRELIQALLSFGTVTASVPGTGSVEELRGLGCRVVLTDIDRRGINPVKDAGLFLRYFSLLRKEKPDLVITYTIKPNIYGGIACRLLGIPYAVNITGLGTAFQKQGALRKLVTFLYKTALKKAKVVFFENAGNMQTLLDEGIVKEAQTCLLNGAGVNTAHYAYAPYPTDDADTRFLFVGRVMREKGVDELFSAMQRLNAEGRSCTLDVLGACEENYTDTLAGHTAEGWLRYHGLQKDVRPFIENSHCFVLPSYHEGMANTNLECASMGRPLITSRIHGCKEAVEEDVSGLLCQPQDADSLYEAMAQFLEMPRERREAMGRSGRARMEDAFDKKKVVTRTIQALGLDPAFSENI